jgi:hypothetical protein
MSRTTYPFCPHLRTMTTLSHERARRVYDRIGTWQDTQAFYEDRATALVLAYGD